MKHTQQSPRFGFWVYVLIVAVMAYVITMTPASAHALWKPGSQTPPRSNDLINNLKAQPCGNLSRGNNPAVFQKGSEIMVEWVESINHQGYFKINFSQAGDANFQPLLIKKDANDQNPQANYPDDQNNQIPAGEVHSFTGLITLPDVVCTDCTLQLIQVMVANNGSESFYYSCSDINLVADDPNDNTPPANVAGLTSAPGDQQVNLSWTNPAADYYRTLVLQSDAVIADVPGTGTEYMVGDAIGNSTVVYVGNGQIHQVTGLTNGNKYYYKAFAYDLRVNYAAGVTAEADLPAQAANQAPMLDDMFAVQGGNDTNTVTIDGGNVQIPAQVTDPNPGDQHTYDWGMPNAQLVDLNAAPEVFEFDPTNVSLGSYTLNLVVSDNGTPIMNDAKSLTIQVVDSAAAPIPPPASPPPASPTPAPAASGGDSGGCSVDPQARFSPLFILMLVTAVAYFGYRLRRRISPVRVRRRR